MTRRLETTIEAGKKLTLTVREAAEILGISERHAYQLIRDDRFPVRILKLGASRKVSLLDLERYLEGEAS